MITNFKLFEEKYGKFGSFGGVAGFRYSEPNTEYILKVKIIVPDKNKVNLDKIVNNFKYEKSKLSFQIVDINNISLLVELKLTTKLYIERQIQSILKEITEYFKENIQGVEMLTHTLTINDLSMDEFVDKVNSRAKKIGF